MLFAKIDQLLTHELDSNNPSISYIFNHKCDHRYYCIDSSPEQKSGRLHRLHSPFALNLIVAHAVSGQEVVTVDDAMRLIAVGVNMTDRL